MTTDLQRNVSRAVTLEFRDGEVLDVVLLNVDPDEHEDVTFEVIAIRKALSEARYDARNVYVASIDNITAVTPLPAEH